MVLLKNALAFASGEMIVIRRAARHHSRQSDGDEMPLNEIVSIVSASVRAGIVFVEFEDEVI